MNNNCNFFQKKFYCPVFSFIHLCINSDQFSWTYWKGPIDHVAINTMFYAGKSTLKLVFYHTYFTCRPKSFIFVSPGQQNVFLIFSVFIMALTDILQSFKNSKGLPKGLCNARGTLAVADSEHLQAVFLFLLCLSLIWFQKCRKPCSGVPEYKEVHRCPLHCLCFVRWS